MRSTFLIAAAFVAASSSAMAADTFSNFYGNTLTITGSDGSKTTAFVNADMTWEQHWANGTVAKGTYAWKDATTACFTQTDPAPKAGDQATVCLPNQAAHNVGDTWSASGADGKSATLALTAGR